MRLFLLVACLLGILVADVYLGNPRGSNNRLNEQSANRANGNRLFDSQNNGRGGHNTGDRFDKAAGDKPSRQYSMQFYASGATEAEASKLIVEWTNQHGCGGNSDSPHKTNCNVVFQMMCQTNGTDGDYPTGQGSGEKDLMERGLYMRDGTDTNTQNYEQPNKNELYGDFDEMNKKYNARMTKNYENVQTSRGLQETVWWYDMCRYRSRNKGLYIADQELKAGSLGYVGSERTRQNNNGNRRGYECPEERDHHPYWQPTHQNEFMDKYQTTPWVDVAYLTGNMSDCDRVNEGSENRAPKYRCVMPKESSRTYGYSIDEESCKKEGASVEYRIRTVTGTHENAKTDGKIFLVLHGAKNIRTKKWRLDDPKINDFEKGESNDFVFTDTDVGDLECMELTIEGTDGWLPSEVVVKFGEPERRYTTGILTNEWLDDYGTKRFCDLSVDPSGCIKANTEYNGADLKDMQFALTNVYECVDKCKSTEACKSLTFVKTSGTCNLKSKPYGSKVISNNNAISANKDCFRKEGAQWVAFHGYLEIISAANNEAECDMYKKKDKRNKISWMELRSDKPDDKHCVVQAPLPKCAQSPWTRVNHLGNSADNDGNPSRVEIDMPYFPSGISKRCTLRIRYNITTDEFDAYGTDHRHNYDLSKGVISPVEQNPFIDVSGMSKPLRLAMNTNQFGRTFQDRTHMFVVLPRTDAMEGATLHNLNVRGKRGNIVQTFPATEYDFIPNKLSISEIDLLHIQWTGSNTHNNGNPGGDGQTGDAGEGTGGTDRHNFLQMLRSDLNFPAPFEKSPFWDMVESVNYPKATAMDLAIGYATSGYYCGYEDFGMCKSGHHVKDDKKNAVQQQLNNAPASYFGHVLKFNKPGTCVYICTRNNNFTNRSQKGVIMVTPK